MVDRQLTLFPTDIDPKGPAVSLGSRNVVPNKSGPATVTKNTQTEKISHKQNGGTIKKHRQASQCTMKSASKAKKVKVAMVKKFVTKIGTPENNKILMK